MALHSESDSVRDECSSGVRSEAEEAEQDRRQQRGKGEVSPEMAVDTRLSLSLMIIALAFQFHVNCLWVNVCLA